MIDYSARAKLASGTRDRGLVNGAFSSVMQGLQLKEENQQIMDEVMKKDDMVASSFTKLANALALVIKKIPGAINLPKIFNVQGKVEVSNMAEFQTKNLEIQLASIYKQLQTMKAKPFPTNFVVDNLFEMEEYFNKLDKSISGLKTAISSIPAAKLEMPKIEIPKMPKFEMPKFDTSKIEELLDELNDQIAKIKTPKIEFPKSIDVGNFPIQMVPQPVTNITLNGLQGTVKTTSATVTTSPTQLPGYGQLFNRRAVMIYNNSANTIYIGGSDVTVSNGMPVPASSYSPILDAGYNMIVYGIANESDNVRVLEVSKDKTQNIQE